MNKKLSHKLKKMDEKLMKANDLLLDARIIIKQIKDEESN